MYSNDKKIEAFILIVKKNITYFCLEKNVVLAC